MTNYPRRRVALDLCAGDWRFQFCLLCFQRDPRLARDQFPDRFLPYPAQLGRTDAVD